MSGSATTYIIFDADTDMSYYRLMQAWKANRQIDFDFENAHDLNNLTDRASEDQIKRKLRERFSYTDQAIVLIGENTRNLHRFVRWEQEVALDLDIPIIAVNLNGEREMDPDRCPPIIRNQYVLHISFGYHIIHYAMTHFPGEFRRRNRCEQDGPRFYDDSLYRELGYVT